MRAMLLSEPGPVESGPLVCGELADPQPGPHQIVIEVSVCGVCHTDLHELEGELPLRQTPVIPGHQVVGTVLRRGSNATRFEMGERVGVAWLHETCRHCEFCQNDNENLCGQARFTGWDVHGGYAEQIAVPEQFAYRIPDVFSDAEAAPLLCGGIIGFRALRLSEIKPGQRLGLYGFGSSAHIVIQIARHWNCEVFVFSRSESHRALAQKLGATWTGTAQETPPAKMHGSIVFAPAGSLVKEALRVMEKGATLALAGIYMTPIPELDYETHLYHERTIRSVANSTRQDGEELLRVAAQIPVRTRIQTFPLAQANEALMALKNGSIDGAGVLDVSSSTQPESESG